MTWSIIGALIGVHTWITLPDPLVPRPGEGDVVYAPGSLLQAVVEGGLILAILGGVSGVAFAAILGVTERRQRRRALSVWRVALWGALGSLWLPIVGIGLTWAAYGVDVPSLPWWFGPYAALGAASAAATLLFARRNDSRRESGQPKVCDAAT